MSDTLHAKLGQRIRIVAPEMSFNDYAFGETGIVTGTGPQGVDVEWEDMESEGRCCYVYHREYEVIHPRPQPRGTHHVTHT